MQMTAMTTGLSSTPNYTMGYGDEYIQFLSGRR